MYFKIESVLRRFRSLEMKILGKTGFGKDCKGV